MKRYLFIILLIIILLQAGGLMLVYQASQQIVKFWMARVIDTEESRFEQITLSISEYHSSKINRKELLYKGNMYDVKSQVVHNDSIHLTVINDMREKQIVDRIKYIAGQKNRQHKDLPNKIIKLYTLDYIHPSLQACIDVLLEISEIYRAMDVDYPSFKPDILSPPPRLG